MISISVGFMLLMFLLKQGKKMSFCYVGFEGFINFEK